MKQTIEEDKDAQIQDDTHKSCKNVIHVANVYFQVIKDVTIRPLSSFIIFHSFR